MADGVLPAKIRKAGLLRENEEFKYGDDGCRSGAPGNASPLRDEMAEWKFINLNAF